MEDRALAERAFHGDSTMMLLHDPLDEREPESRASFPAREKRLKNASANLVGHTGTIIVDSKAGVSSVSGQEPNLDRAAFRENLDRIDQKI